MEKNKLLVVIDAQNDFIDGTLHNQDAIEAMPNIKELVDAAVNLDYDIIYTTDTHNPNTYFETQEGKNLPIMHCEFNTPGWEIHPMAQCPRYYHAKYIIKSSFGTLKWKNEVDLMKYDEVIICGFVTSICVLSNVCILKATEPNTLITVAADATADLNPELKEKTLDVMRAMQVNVVEHYTFDI